MRFFNNNQGFSMVEILVAASMLGMLALAGSKLMQNQTTAMKTIETRAEYTTLLGDIRTILADSASCKATMQNLNAKNTAAGSIVNIRSVTSSGATVNRYTANTNWRLGTAYGNGKVRIISFRLSDAGIPAASQITPVAGTRVNGTTNLIVRFMTGLHPETKAEQFIERNISINVTSNTGTNTIFDCSSSVADNSLNDILKACNSIITPAAMPVGYNSGTEKCGLVQYPGTATFTGGYTGQNFEAVSTQYLRQFYNSINDIFVNAAGDTMTGPLVLQAPASLTVGGVSTFTGVATFNNRVNINNDMYITGAIQMTSDKRKKKEIKDLNNALTKIKKLKPKSYRWKENNAPHMGLIAQELALVFPDLVRETGDGTLAVDYIQLTPVLIKGVQELDKENNELREELNFIKKELCKENKNYKFCKR